LIFRTLHAIGDIYRLPLLTRLAIELPMTWHGQSDPAFRVMVIRPFHVKPMPEK
jgi:hypothetical protein